MLSSTLSCRSGKQVRNYRSSDKRSAINKSKVLFINNEYQLAQSLFNEKIRKLAHGLFVVILLTGNYIQLSESAELSSKLDGKDLPDLVSESEETPCFCDGRFYKSCPPLPSCQSKLPYSSSKELYDHDDGHPDHVDEIKSKYFEDSDDLEVVVTPAPSRHSGIESSYSTVGDRIIRHRKVYVSERPADKDPVIFPISLTIPVEFKEDPAVLIPPPKPIFKMRKYTTYETRPVIEKVPITTTIIKPVGVTKDQIIDS